MSEGLHGILRVFMSRVKKWTYQALENSTGWVPELFWGQVLFRIWDKEIKQLNALFSPLVSELEGEKREQDSSFHC